MTPFASHVLCEVVTSLFQFSYKLFLNSMQYKRTNAFIIGKEKLFHTLTALWQINNAGKTAV